MIKAFKHKGLKQFFEKGTTRGVKSSHSNKLRLILTALHAADEINDMDAPSFTLHQLKGDEKGVWSVSVNGNWRVTFEFVEGDAYILDYRDYH